MRKRIKLIKIWTALNCQTGLSQFRFRSIKKANYFHNPLFLRFALLQPGVSFFVKRTFLFYKKTFLDLNFFIVHNRTNMDFNFRKDIRFNDFGRAECTEISPVAGALEDISLSGCKVHYDAPVSINMENDYEIHFRLSRAGKDALVLMCHPQWFNQKDDGSSEVGFLFLHSLDSEALQSYILQRQKEEMVEKFDGIMPQGDTCQFV